MSRSARRGAVPPHFQKQTFLRSPQFYQRLPTELTTRNSTMTHLPHARQKTAANSGSNSGLGVEGRLGSSTNSAPDAQRQDSRLLCTVARHLAQKTNGEAGVAGSSQTALPEFVACVRERGVSNNAAGFPSLPSCGYFKEPEVRATRGVSKAFVESSVLCGVGTRNPTSLPVYRRLLARGRGSQRTDHKTWRR